VAARGLGELADQPGVAVAQVGGVVRAAALVRQERALGVDPRDLARVGEVREHRRARGQGVGVGRDEGGEHRRRPVAPVLEHAAQRLVRAGGLREADASAAVVVQIHEPRQQVVVRRRHLGDLRVEAGLAGLDGGTGERQAISPGHHDAVVDHRLGQDDSAPQDDHGSVLRHGPILPQDRRSGWIVHSGSFPVERSERRSAQNRREPGSSTPRIAS
jgi:hypothetical protein